MEIIDGTAKFKIKDKRQHHCLGEIVALISTPPIYEHLIECNGQTISAEDYPELVQILGTNIVPNLNGRVLQGSNTPNTFISAGLPNITGKLQISGDRTYWTTPTDFTGTGSITALRYQSAYLSQTVGAGSEWMWDGFTIDASKSSAIYGNSTTVQPPAYTVKYYICYQS